MNARAKITHILGGILIGCVCQAAIPDKVIYDKLKKISLNVRVPEAEIKSLADTNFDPNRIFDKDNQYTPLMMIVDIPDERAALELIDILVRKGANVNKVSKKRHDSALSLIRMHDRPAIVRKLLASGADPLIKDKLVVRSALDWMAHNLLTNDLNVVLDDLQVRGKLEDGLHGEDKDGNTPFLLVIKSNQSYEEIKKVVDLMLRYGADPNYENSKGESVMSYLQKQTDQKSQRIYNDIKQKLLYFAHKALEKMPAGQQDISMRVSEYLGVGLPKKVEPVVEKPKVAVVSQEENMPEQEENMSEVD